MKEARYQLRQSPMWECGSDLIVTADSILADPGGRLHIGGRRVPESTVAHLDTPGISGRIDGMTGPDGSSGPLGL